MKTASCNEWFGRQADESSERPWFGSAECSPRGLFGGKPEKIVILGSNTIGEELAPRLVAEYKKDHPAVAFDSEFKGTTYGLGALIVGRCDIAAASRDATTNEVELAQADGVQFNDYVIGAYDVAVIVNAGNPVGNLTRDQVRDLFTGAVQNWKDVGGPDAPVHLYIRHPISGTYLGFRELAMENKPYALNLKTFTNYMGHRASGCPGRERDRLLHAWPGQHGRRQARVHRRSAPRRRFGEQRPISVCADAASLHR